MYNLLLAAILFSTPSHSYQGFLGEFLPYNAYQFLDLIEDGDVNYSRGEFVTAESLYQQAYDYALKLKNYKYLSISLISLGTALGKQEKPSQALGKFIQALENKISILNPDILSVLFFNTGVAYHKLNQLDSAIVYYSNAINITPDEYTIFMNRADAYFDRHQFDLAIQDYTKTITFDSSYVDAYKKRGLSFLHQYEHAHAIENYNQALKLKPEYADVMVLIADVYTIKNDRISARYWYEQALKNKTFLVEYNETELQEKLKELSKFIRE